ncbi:MAG: GAF domain-containing sensor histidine kinase [Ardenticatenaceae bacterium]|nr:GAF domain-containing sensor histidine kinase [Anaerolineales bacterium]MCB8939699.1 GAF domain-containing sensor histidine kinase [Ardenticatenaceae bacterium]MCB8975217.1 GAF domain-containing sensor histidine kinase [Ardenticatenaceae bacterium]
MIPSPISSSQTQSERLQALYHMAVELSALHSLQSVLNTALRHCLDLTESQFGFVGLNTADGRALDVVAMQGFFAESEFYEHNHIIPLRPSIFARAVLENRPVSTDDARYDPSRFGQPKGHPPVAAFLGVPLRIRDKPIGMIGVANRPQPYEDDHEQLLLTYAAQVAIVIRNVQLYEQLTTAKEALEEKVAKRTAQLEVAREDLAQKAMLLQQLLSETVDVQESERQRISQDMHDGINQLLVGAMLELRSAQKRLANGRIEPANESLASVRGILHRVEAEIKRIIHDLRPPTLDALGLVPALRRYAERFTQYTNIPCTVTVFGEPCRLASRAEIGVYRLMQEALQNVSTHADATRTEVVAAFSPRTFKLTIIDDGQGFDLLEAEQNKNGRLGLLGMKERAQSLGGHLTIWTQPEQGTRVELIVPVTEPL